jgi:hypothetical protein
MYTSGLGIFPRPAPDAKELLDSNDEIDDTKTDHCPLQKRIGYQRTQFGIPVQQEIVIPEVHPG